MEMKDVAYSVFKYKELESFFFLALVALVVLLSIALSYPSISFFFLKQCVG